MAISKAQGSPFNGINLHALEKWSTMMRKQMWESKEGNSMIKSIPICDQDLLGTGSGDFMGHIGSPIMISDEREDVLAAWVSRAWRCMNSDESMKDRWR